MEVMQSATWLWLTLASAIFMTIATFGMLGNGTAGTVLQRLGWAGLAGGMVATVLLTGFGGGLWLSGAMLIWSALSAIAARLFLTLIARPRR